MVTPPTATAPSTTTDAEPCWDVPATADYADVSRTTIRRAIWTGDLPAFKVGPRRARPPGRRPGVARGSAGCPSGDGRAAMSATTIPEPSGPFDEPLMLVTEGAEYLRLPATSVYRLIKAGELPALVLGPRRIRLRRVDLDAWLVARTTGGVA
jgi:excisionase family DNA binding protein